MTIHKNGDNFNTVGCLLVVTAWVGMTINDEPGSNVIVFGRYYYQ